MDDHLVEYDEPMNNIEGNQKQTAAKRTMNLIPFVIFALLLFIALFILFFNVNFLSHPKGYKPNQIKLAWHQDQ